MRWLRRCLTQKVCPGGASYMERLAGYGKIFSKKSTGLTHGETMPLQVFRSKEHLCRYRRDLLRRRGAVEERTRPRAITILYSSNDEVSWFSARKA